MKIRSQFLLTYLIAHLVPTFASFMKWNESFTTLWKDCRHPNYSRSMVVHYGLKMIWCPNAKVGTTSLYDLFRKHLGIGEHVRCIKEFPKKCSPFVSMAVIPAAEQRRLCERGFTTFTFVRNPYERVLSAFLDKIGYCRVDRKTGKQVSASPGYEFYCATIRKLFSVKVGEPVTFLHFVRYLKTRRSDEYNQHWQSYRSRCNTGTHGDAVHYDILGRLESGLNSTLNLLFEKLGIDPTLYQHSTRNSHDAHAKLKRHYHTDFPKLSQEIIGTVRGLYKNDIYDFGYRFGWEKRQPSDSIQQLHLSIDRRVIP